MNELKYEDLKTVNFWVVPDAGSFMLSLITLSGMEIDILITQAIDLEDYDEDMIPGRIYVDHRIIDLKSKEESIVLSVLSDLLKNDRLGHKEGLAVFRTREIIHFFHSDQAIRLSNFLKTKAID